MKLNSSSICYQLKDFNSDPFHMRSVHTYKNLLHSIFNNINPALLSSLSVSMHHVRL